MLPTDVFFTDVERVIAAFTEADRPRAYSLIEELDRIAVKVPRVAERCYAYQAQLFSQLHLFPQALECVSKALSQLPNNEEFLLLRADIYRSAQNHTAALQDYALVLEQHPDSVTARLHRAEMRQAQGQPALALDDLNQALRLEPRSLRLLYRRGLILTELRRTTEALQDFRNVAHLSADPELKQKATARLRELGEK